jgi:hypothetical protein
VPIAEDRDGADRTQFSRRFKILSDHELDSIRGRSARQNEADLHGFFTIAGSVAQYWAQVEGRQTCDSARLESLRAGPGFEKASSEANRNTVRRSTGPSCSRRQSRPSLPMQLPQIHMVRYDCTLNSLARGTGYWPGSTGARRSRGCNGESHGHADSSVFIRTQGPASFVWSAFLAGATSRPGRWACGREPRGGAVQGVEIPVDRPIGGRKRVPGRGQFPAIRSSTSRPRPLGASGGRSTADCRGNA